MSAAANPLGYRTADMPLAAMLLSVGTKPHPSFSNASFMYFEAFLCISKRSLSDGESFMMDDKEVWSA